MAENKSDGLLGGMIIGAAIGAIAGVLAAPRTGRETRRILKKSADALPELAEDLATSIQFQADRLSDTSLQNWDGTLTRLREAIAAGRSAGRTEWERQSTADDTRYPASAWPRRDYTTTDYTAADYATGHYPETYVASEVQAPEQDL